MKKIGAEGLTGALYDILKEYEATSEKAVKAAVLKTSEDVVKATKAKAPKRTGAYRRRWTSKEDEWNRLGYKQTVYNKKPTYRLTHLLEHGHGGPHPAGAKPHITPDEETARMFEENLKKELSK